MKKKTIPLEQMRKDAAAIFRSGVAAVAPYAAVKNSCHIDQDHLIIRDARFPLSAFKRIIVVGFGKATAPMAKAMEDILGDRLSCGIAIVKHGHTTELSTINLMEAGHPVPDENGFTATRALMDMIGQAEKTDLIICLVSGGGSALLVAPVSGISLADKQQTSRVLIDCGAAIQEINTIRKHLSRVKGGGVAAMAFPATLVTLMISDVVGDDPEVIASGPTVPDPTTFADCAAIIHRYHLHDQLPASVLSHLERGFQDELPETPDSHHRAFHDSRHHIIASNATAVSAAAETARQLGYLPLILSSMIEGDTKEAALFHTAIVREIRKTGHPITPPACILSGGETTVRVTGQGKGGRNQEFALACVKNIHHLEQVVILSAGTDGNDGPTDAAGAFADTQTFNRALALNLDPDLYLKRNDSYHFFEALEDLFITGPTNTNVMDLRIMLING